MARKVHGHMSFGWAHSPAGSASRQPRPLCLPEMGVAIAPFCIEAKRASGAEPEGEEGTRGEGKKISGTRPRKLSTGNLFLPFFTFHLPQKDDLWILSPSHPCSNWLFEQLQSPDPRHHGCLVVAFFFFHQRLFRPRASRPATLLKSPSTLSLALVGAALDHDKPQATQATWKILGSDAVLELRHARTALASEPMAAIIAASTT